MPTGAIDGHWGQLLNQLAGVAIAWGISIVGTLVLLFVVDKIIGLRVSPEHEAAGLDLSQHGEEGYDLNSLSVSSFSSLCLTESCQLSHFAAGSSKL